MKEVLVPADGPQLLATHIVIQHLEFLPSVHPTFLLPRLKLIEDKAVLCPGVSYLSSLHRSVLNIRIRM